MKDQIEVDADKIRTITNELSKRYPCAGFSFGYIGNVSLQYGDDRGCYVFTKLQEENGSSVSFGGWQTKRMSMFLKTVEENIESWVETKVKRILDAEQADKDAYAAGKSVKYRSFRK